MRYPSAALAVMLLGLSGTALAAGGYENFRSEVRAVSPPVRGLEVEVIGGDKAVDLRNESGLLVVVEGYDDEPYLRFKPNGVVEQNQRSPATYLNADRRGAQPVPAKADPQAAPSWKPVSKDGEFRWFDHRTHVTSGNIPRRFREATERKKIFDWQIPIRAGDTVGRVTGTLYWDPSSSSDGFPVGLLITGVGALALLTIAGLLVRRRRRPPRMAAPGESSAEEAW
jgi:MYXO-CTERM domain-containing protein